MSNIIWMRSKTDWFVMNMVKKHILDLKKSKQDEDTIAAIDRNEMALRSFFQDIKERSSPLAA